jgi:hypothetical protein
MGDAPQSNDVPGGNGVGVYETIPGEPMVLPTHAFVTPSSPLAAFDKMHEPHFPPRPPSICVISPIAFASVMPAMSSRSFPTHGISEIASSPTAAVCSPAKAEETKSILVSRAKSILCVIATNLRNVDSAEFLICDPHQGARSQMLAEGKATGQAMGGRAEKTDEKSSCDGGQQ